MSTIDDLRERPWEFDLLWTLRLIERSHDTQPRIGDSASRADDYVALGENPFLEFPASSIEAADEDARKRLRLFVRFLGLLGPQGPLPLQTTDEVYGWWSNGHEGFSRFLDLLNHRFLQLYFRAWADARPAAQADRPGQDRFVAYIGSTIGLGSAPYQKRDTVSDAGRLVYAGLLGDKARSGSRLCQAVEGLFGIRCEVEEFVGTFLPFEKGEQSRLGRSYCGLGVDCLIGASVFSVEDKIRLRLFARDLEEFGRFLPNGSLCTPLADLLFFYLGSELDCEVEIALPRRSVRPLRLGEAGCALGYTTWMVKSQDPAAKGYRFDARLNPAERARRQAPKSEGRQGENHGRHQS
ncbi:MULTISPECIES: type VI secretion system baseplate subunit TssG [Methylobacterium]|uniref:type VI secretion system baseplate subunit TssG n=1 Tax=Methylobacterium TaxID=407 RepID=UPI0010509CA7|nr:MULTISPECIES: type VI secretion system baseplate subunit TssG [Methylobacterium]MDR7040130.1 type VI secretion system protein ImpH [Methylobacterium sp. BE186]